MPRELRKGKLPTNRNGRTNPILKYRIRLRLKWGQWNITVALFATTLNFLFTVEQYENRDEFRSKKVLTSDFGNEFLLLLWNIERINQVIHHSSFNGSIQRNLRKILTKDESLFDPFYILHPCQHYLFEFEINFQWLLTYLIGSMCNDLYLASPF